MPTPSLVNIPFITAPNVLFSQIPESGAGDFTVTRTTSPVVGQSTRVNAAGLIELVADNVARLDYPLGGAVNGCPALLVEPSAQNLALQSAGFSVSATWVPEGTPNPTQVTANTTATLDPAGGNTADIITLVSGNANQLRQSFVSTSGTTYTVSVFLKNIALTSGQTFLFSTTNQEATVNQVNCTIDLANLTITAVTVGTGVTVSNAALDDYGNGWYRARFTFSFAVGGTNSYIRLRQPNNVGTNYAFYAWGAQLEVGSVPTSYIPTTTATVARSADVIRKTGITSLIGQSEGTVYFEVEVTAEARDKWICTLDSSSSNYIQVWIDSVRRIRVLIVNAGSTVMTALIPSASSVGYHKMAFAYNTATNGCEMFIDGVQNPVASRTVTGAGLPALNNFTLGSFTTSNSDSLKGRIRAAALYPNRLSNLRLEFLTAPVTYTTYAQMANALSYILP